MNSLKRLYSSFYKDCIKINNINNFFDNVNKNKKISILKNKKIVYDIINKNYENISSNIGKINSNSSGKFGENIVEELLILKNIKYYKQYNYKNLRPDFITDTDIIEVKTTLKNNNNYDNILFSGFKYYNLAKVLDKSIKIYLVGYDENVFINFKKNNELFDDFLKNHSNKKIEYIFFHNELMNYLKND